MSRTIRGYLAGDGLKKGNQMLRMLEREKLRTVSNLDVFNPWEQKDINDKSKNPTAEMIFDKDTKAMLDAEVIVVDVDNNSVGTTSEMGQMWGINYMIKRLDKILEDAENAENFAEYVATHVIGLLMEIPYKNVYWQTTDIRDTNTPESGHRRSHSINQYLYGMMLDLAGEAKDFDQILEELKLLK